MTPDTPPAWVRHAMRERARARQTGTAPRGMIAINPNNPDAVDAYLTDLAARAPQSWHDALAAAIDAPGATAPGATPPPAKRRRRTAAPGATAPPAPPASPPAASDPLRLAARALFDWAREHTSPRDPNSPHELLVALADALGPEEAP